MTCRSLPAIAVFMTACTDVNFTAQENTPPEPTILSHADGDTVVEGYAFWVRGSVVDNGGVDDVELSWFAGEELVCAEAADPLSGASDCEMGLTALGTVRVRLEAKDSQDAIGSAFVDLIVAPSEPPIAEIVRPLAAGTYYSNTPVTFEGQLFDAEDAVEALVAAWTVDGDAVTGGTSPDASGGVTTTALLPEGSHTVSLTVTDGSGKSAADEVAIVVSGPNGTPTCEFVSPADGAFSGQWNEVVLAGVVGDPDIAADALAVTFSSDRDGLLAAVVPTVNGDVALPWATLSLGEHALTLTAVDDAGATCEVTVGHTVVEPPTAPVVQVDPDPPQSADDLVCTIVVPSVDPSPSGPLSYIFEWTADGVPLVAADTTFLPGDTVPEYETAPGQVWECSARATDGLTTGGPGVDSVTIAIPTVVEIHAGLNHTCQLDTNRWLECWGSGANNVLDLSDGTFETATVGPYATCGVNLFGSVQCVGLDTFDRIDTSGLIGDFAMIDGGDSHGCGIDSLGEVQCWGDATDGKTDTSGLSGTWLAVGASYSHSCAVSTANELACWGEDAFDKVSDIPPGIDWATISVGRFHNCGLDVTGLAHCFGKDVASVAPGGTFAQVDAGNDVSCGVRGTGALECWGSLTGPGEVNEAPPGLYSRVSVGNGHQCAIDTAGAVTCWGDNTNGELNAPLVWW